MNQKLQPSTASMIQVIGNTNSENLGSSSKSGALTNNTLYTVSLTITRTAFGNDQCGSGRGRAEP